MSTQETILNYLYFLESKKEELIILKNLRSDSEKIKMFDSLLDDYNTLIDQSSLAIKSLQIDNYNLDENVAQVTEENELLKKKNEILENTITALKHEKSTFNSVLTKSDNKAININHQESSSNDHYMIDYRHNLSKNERHFESSHANNSYGDKFENQEYLPKNVKQSVVVEYNKGTELTFAKREKEREKEKESFKEKDSTNKKYVFDEIPDEYEEETHDYKKENSSGIRDKMNESRSSKHNSKYESYRDDPEGEIEADHNRIKHAIQPNQFQQAKGKPTNSVSNKTNYNNSRKNTNEDPFYEERDKKDKESSRYETSETNDEQEKTDFNNRRSKISLRLKLKEGKNNHNAQTNAINSKSTTPTSTAKKSIRDVPKPNKVEHNTISYDEIKEKGEIEMDAYTKEILVNLETIIANQSYFIQKYNQPNIKTFLERIIRFELKSDVLKRILRDLSNLKNEKSNREDLVVTTSDFNRKENRNESEERDTKRSKSGNKTGVTPNNESNNPYIDPLQFNKILRSYTSTPNDKAKKTPFKGTNNNQKNFDKTMPCTNLPTFSQQS